MKIHQLDSHAALNSLHSGASGLPSAEAARRLREYGANVVQGVRRDPMWLRFLRELTHFFAIIMWLAAVLAFFAEWHSPGEGMGEVGLAIIAVIVVSALFSFWQEYRVEKALTALRRLLPSQVKVLRDGAVSILMAEQLVPGDVILLEQGDNVPADCRVIESYALGVNNATITGESVAQLRDASVSAVDEWQFAANILLAGTAVVAGQGRAVIFATGMKTAFGRIAHLTETGGEQDSPLRREIARLSRTIAVVAIAMGALFFAVGRWLDLPLWHNVLFAIGIIVALVPEGLMATLTLALVLAAQRMVQRKVLIRHLPAIETLGSATVICTDKTGTLTQNRMAVEQLCFGVDGEMLSLTALQQAPEQIGNHRALFECAAFCHDLREVREGEWLGDPMEMALHRMAVKMLGTVPPSRRLQEWPFDSERMRLSVLQQGAESVMLYSKGAPEKLLPLCSHILIAGTVQTLDDTGRAAIVQAQCRMAEQGLRVLALAYRSMPADEPERQNTRRAASQVEEQLVFCGLAGLDDPPRPEVPAAIAQCHAAGIRVVMITGDHPRTAVAIARRIGLLRGDQPLVITGEQLRQYSSQQIQLALDAEDIVFARVAAEQKMLIVDALKQKQHVVAVTGDGVNDAPALKAAHIGVAMGLNGTDVAREAADMVLLDDNFASIVNGIEEGRAVFANIRKFLTYILAHNVAELLPYLLFVLFRVPLALTPVQMLLIDMAADSLTAVGLGAEKPDPAVMQQKPRGLRERLLDWQTGVRAYLLLGLLESLAVMTVFFSVLLHGGWHYNEPLAMHNTLYQQATTAAFGTIILMQIVNVFLCRSDRRSVFSTGLRGNRLILGGIALELTVFLLACYSPWGHWLVDTASPPWQHWLLVLPFVLAMLLADELWKFFRRQAVRP